jgi:hypothetical protein
VARVPSRKTLSSQRRSPPRATSTSELAQAPKVAPEAFQWPIDFLFIHGDHSIEGCAGDFLRYAPQVETQLRETGHVLAG